MIRWLVRFSTATLIGALLVWFWNRYNQDLLEDELDEEIPFEFDVAAEDMPLSAPEQALPAGATPDDTAVAPTALAPAAAAAEETVATATAGTEESAAATLLDSPAPTPAGAGDNVIAIKGIGPKYGAKLAEMGITTFGALLGTPLDTLELAFPRVSAEELENWLEQARELAASSEEPA